MAAKTNASSVCHQSVGRKSYYAHPVIASGGELTDDLTQGYGPERFLAKKAAPGT